VHPRKPFVIALSIIGVIALAVPAAVALNASPHHPTGSSSNASEQHQLADRTAVSNQRDASRVAQAEPTTTAAVNQSAPAVVAPAEPNEAAEPAEPNEAAEPAEPNEAAEANEAAEPADANKAAEPAEATDGDHGGSPTVVSPSAPQTNPGGDHGHDGGGNGDGGSGHNASDG
jgi:hypothetical protein